MYVLVDESGDLGFSEAATNYLAVAHIECEAPVRLRTEPRRSLKRLHQKSKYSESRNELKFSRMDDYCRKSVLAKIGECDASPSSVVLEKVRVKANLRKDPSVLHKWCVVHNIMLSLLPQITGGNKIQGFHALSEI